MGPIQNTSIIEVSTGQKPFSRAFVKRSLAGGAGATTIKSVCKVPKGKILFVEAVIFAKDATSGDLACYNLKASVANKAGTVALLGTVTVAHTAENDATWACTLVANDTTKALDLQVTPDATNATVFWGFATVVSA